MGTFTALHEAVVIVATAMAIAVFLGLAIYVATQNLYHPVAWLFSLSCLIVAGAYFISFFTVSGSESSLLFFLRLRWVVIIFGPTLFLRLTFFYFPPTWQRYRSWILRPAYLLTLGLAWATLSTDWVIVAPRHAAAAHIAMPLPGPLMPFLIAFSILEIIGVILGLLHTYRLTHSPSLRRQIGFLLPSTGLVFIAGAIHAFNIFMDDKTHLPHEVPDALLIGAAFLYVKAVIYYGSFVGRPLARKDLLYASLTATTGLGALYLTLALDHWLMSQTRFPYPPSTAILVLALAVSFPAVSRWVTGYLDKWFFRSERQQQALIDQLAEVLAVAPNIEQLQTDLLEALLLLLDARSGFIASANPASSSTSLTIQIVRGNLDLQPGAQIDPPPLANSSAEAQLIIPALFPLQPESVWQEMALFCPLAIAAIDGVLALGEKRDGAPFTAQDTGLYVALIKRLRRLEQTAPLRQQRNYYLEASRNQYQVLQQLSRETPPTAHYNLTTPENLAPLEIRILGPLQVTRNGQIATESAWGSEKAKVLLAYLLWRSPTGATREELSEALWPERPLEETANVFHVTLHRLRRALQPKTGDKHNPKYILYERGRYRFNTAAPHWLDATEFQRLTTCVESEAQQTAVELYRGIYLEDTAWALPCDVTTEQRRLEQLYANALRHLAAQTDSRSAIIYLEKLLAVEPAEETAHQALVLSYLTQGRGDLARRQVERWRRTLIEFELEPDPEAINVWQMVESKKN